MRITAKQKSARRRNIKVAQSARKRAGGAYKKAYKKARGFGWDKQSARQSAQRAAIGTSKRAGKKLAKTFAKGLAKQKKWGITSKRGQNAFVKGYMGQF